MMLNPRIFEARSVFKLFGRSSRPLRIEARWDEEGGVWYVSDSDVPGLHAEADTPEALLDTLRELVPELVDANLPERSARRKGQDVPIELITHREESIPLGR